MDLRGWKWKCPWGKRNYLLCILFYLTLLLQEHRIVADGGYRQELKNEIQDSTKMDSLSNYLPYDSKEDSDYKRASSFFPLRGKKLSSDDTTDHQLIIPDEENDKRSQFFPLRGKKVPDDLKRASYFTPMRGRKDDGWIDEYDITDENPYKRASSFMPMRGKKKYEAISDYLTKAGTYSNGIAELLNTQNSNNYHSDDKRLSFVPVRGKRSYEEPTNAQVPQKNDTQGSAISNHSAEKRSVSFMPMRGRKDSEDFKDDGPINVVTTLLEKKKYSFMPMRGRRDNDIEDEMLDKRAMFMPMRGRRKLIDSDFQNELNLKRAQYFMPMRGRRTNLRDNVNANTPESESNLLDDKRASSFMPMRGRRTNMRDTVNTNTPESEANLVDDKRASSFMPMRGRRTNLRDIVNNNMPESETNLVDDKRASSFMPMRGRRTNLRDIVNTNLLESEAKLVDDKRASSFMPMRGRRSLSEKHVDSETNHYKRVSSFTPMRGRRSAENFNHPLSSEEQMSDAPIRVRRSIDEDLKVEPWPADQLISLLDKKSSSFMPMRGRRFADRNITVDPWQADQLMSLFNKRSFSFMPMRGRRLEDGNFTVEPWQADQLMSLFNKKSSFMPMRGRRLEDGNFTVEPWPAEQLMSLFNKKSSFMPMRGRRGDMDYTQYNSEETDYNDNDDKRSSYFMPMRGRRLESKEMSFFSPYPYFVGGIGSSLMYKPYSDLGLSYNSVTDATDRSKKLKINWDAVKRAFHASRGKRSDSDMWVKDLIDKWNNKEIDQYEDSDLNNDDIEEDKIYQSRCRIWSKLTRQLSRQYVNKRSEFSDSMHLINYLMDEFYWCQYNNPSRRRKEEIEDQARAKRSIIRPRLALQPNRQYIALKRPMSFFATRGKRMDGSAVDKIANQH